MVRIIASQQSPEAIGQATQIVALVNAIAPIQLAGAAAPALIRAVSEEVTVIQTPNVQAILDAQPTTAKNGRFLEALGIIWPIVVQVTQYLKHLRDCDPKFMF